LVASFAAADVGLFAAGLACRIGGEACYERLLVGAVGIFGAGGTLLLDQFALGKLEFLFALAERSQGGVESSWRDVSVRHATNCGRKQPKTDGPTFSGRRSWNYRRHLSKSWKWVTMRPLRSRRTFIGPASGALRLLDKPSANAMAPRPFGLQL
jgi:hypothetical protein